METSNSPPVIGSSGVASSGAVAAATGLTEAHVEEIRGAIQSQQKFLGELLEHAHRWELEGAELRIYFAAEMRAFAEMVEGRDSLEKIRATAGKVLNRSVRVCAKMESVAATTANAAQAASGTKELREKFERDPMVGSMLQRFGGKISEVKRREVNALQQMLSRLRQVQEDLQRQVNTVAIEASAGGGMVTVKMNGQKQIVEVRIEPEVFASKDQEMLQDLIRAAVNEASRRVDDELANQMKSLAGNIPGMSGIKIPGLF